MKRIFIICLLSVIGLSVTAQYGQVATFKKSVNLSAIRAPVVDDADAVAFWTAAGISNSTQRTAINSLVISLKANSLWTKFLAIYPLVGGTAATHKWNLKDPRDLDAAYRITWNGTVTHSATGADPNGSTGYGDTHLNTSTVFSDNLIHISIYITENTAAGDKEEIGATGSSGSIDVAILARYTGDTFYPSVGSGSFPNTSSTTSIGYWIANRATTSNIEGYKNGTRTVNASQTQGRANTDISLFARNGGSGIYTRYSDRNAAFATIGYALSQAECATLNTIVEAFNDALSRGVQ